MRSSLLVLAALVVASPAHAERMKLAVLPTHFDKSSEGLVPKLFDEYVLSAVQNAGDYEVIGQDDIAALVGFERQKDLVGCDDASCLTNIGGALGVDRIIAVKIARIDPDWMVTSKLINIKTTRVEARTSDIIKGNVKALLSAVPAVVANLFAAAQGRPTRPVASADEAEPKPAVAPPLHLSVMTPPVVATPVAPDPNRGRGSRILGHVLTWGGLGCGAVALAWGWTVDHDTTLSTASSTTHTAGLKLGAFMGGVCLVVTGVGSGIYLNGKARAATGDDDASGYVWYRWMGYVLAAGGSVLPLAAGSDDTALKIASVGLGGSALVFVLSMASGSAYARSRGNELPIAAVPAVLWNGERGVPGMALVGGF
jgi:hypothetical protein